MIEDVKKALHACAHAGRAQHRQRFFKTGRGEYAEGDLFIGVRVPQIRKVARQYQDLPLEEVAILLQSPVHEERFLALCLLIHQYNRKKNPLKAQVFNTYMTHIDHVNNWDLVDLSAHPIVGAYLYDHPSDLLTELAASPSLWRRRVAVVATLYFIRKGACAITIEIATLLRQDRADLIQKAVGWMLREVGKRDLRLATAFLDQYAATLPRTLLRYALERFEPAKRKHYMELAKRNV